MEKTMIPKTLHFCWFGGNPQTPLLQKCMESWKKLLPEYDFVEWNENNFDVASNRYVREAYEAKKWAFVSDYVRLYALYHFGGVYVDADLEVLKPLDRFLEHKAFSGYESENVIPTAVMGAEKGHPWIKLLLDDYSDRAFVKPDGSYDQTANVIPITRRTVEQYGLVLNNELLTFGDGVAIYPKEYFCPLEFSTRKIFTTENTHAIHHFSASWWEEGEWEERLHKIRYRESMKEKRFKDAADEMRLAYGFSRKKKHLLISMALSALASVKGQSKVAD